MSILYLRKIYTKNANNEAELNKVGVSLAFYDYRLINYRLNVEKGLMAEKKEDKYGWLRAKNGWLVL